MSQNQSTGHPFLPPPENKGRPGPQRQGMKNAPRVVHRGSGMNVPGVLIGPLSEGLLRRNRLRNAGRRRVEGRPHLRQKGRSNAEGARLHRMILPRRKQGLLLPVEKSPHEPNHAAVLPLQLPLLSRKSNRKKYPKLFLCARMIIRQYEKKL